MPRHPSAIELLRVLHAADDQGPIGRSGEPLRLELWHQFGERLTIPALLGDGPMDFQQFRWLEGVQKIAWRTMLALFSKPWIDAEDYGLLVNAWFATFGPIDTHWPGWE